MPLGAWTESCLSPANRIWARLLGHGFYWDMASIKSALVEFTSPNLKREAGLSLLVRFALGLFTQVAEIRAMVGPNT